MDQPSIAALSADEQFQQHCRQPTPASERYWREWLQAQPERRATFRAARALVLQLSLQADQKEAQTQWKRLAQQIERQPVAVARTLQPNYRWRVAASILFLMASTAFYFWLNSPQPNYVATGFGETQNVQLPDGSRVVLNANSTLTYPAEWKANERSLTLTGEAYFQIEHRPEQPFTVQTEQGNIRVLGTTFNVQQRAEKLDVTLTTGKIQLDVPQREPTLLLPGERAVVTASSLVKTTVDTTTVVAWRNGKLVFNNNSVAEIIARLETEYNWQVQVFDRSVLTRKVTATVPHDKPTLLLEALHEIYGLNFKKIDAGRYELH